MRTKTDLERRDRLAYLALYYAIHGDTERSEQIRRFVRQMEGQEPPVEEPEMTRVGA